MTVALYGGIHHVVDGFAGEAIVLGTQAALKGGWVMGPKYPATHAFVVVETEAGAWRLDGKPSRAEWSPFDWGAKKAPPQALWRIKAPDAAIMAGVARARAITHAAYDWGEIAGATAAAFSILPGMSKLRLLGQQDFFSTAMICTQVLRQTLLAVFPGQEQLARMIDLYPERLGQIQQGAESVWTQRKLLVSLS